MPPTDQNPYTTLLTTHPTPHSLTQAYTTHRLTRRTQQRTALLSPTSSGLTPDPILTRLLRAETHPASSPSAPSADHRHNITLWARPPLHVRELITHIQRTLRCSSSTSPSILRNTYFQPEGKLHLTVFEVAHSLSFEGQEGLLRGIGEGLVGESVELCAVRVEGGERSEPNTGGGNASGARGRKRKVARVGRPMVVFDERAVAVSWVPVVRVGRAGRAGRAQGAQEAHEAQGAQSAHPAHPVQSAQSAQSAQLAQSSASVAGFEDEEDEDSNYTYHHLRSDFWELFHRHNVPVASRYVLPSCHMTIARFVDGDGTSTAASSSSGDKTSTLSSMPGQEEIQTLIRKIDEINEWLEREFAGEKGKWVVGEERGLEFRVGTSWYGGGETLRVGRAVAMGANGDGDGDGHGHGHGHGHRHGAGCV